MESVVRAYDRAKSRYDQYRETEADVAAVASAARRLLIGVPTFSLPGPKAYSIFEAEVKTKKGNDETRRSRPFLPELMLSPEELDAAWAQLPDSVDTVAHRLTFSEDSATKLVYTTIMSFAACYDLWKPGSRKTPGTYFEVVLGTILKMLAPDAKRGKHISLPSGAVVEERPLDEIIVADEGSVLELEESDQDDETENNRGSVSTDIVFEFDGEPPRGIVVPAKITTRERIVQPFAHQRILDSAFGEGRYISLLACVSETQRDDKRNRVNDICVPGTIALFQRHLAKFGGIYYLDPPQRYLQLESEGLINVRAVGALLTGDFGRIVMQLRRDQSALSAPAAGGAHR